jgi:perosamine synthetase
MINVSFYKPAVGEEEAQAVYEQVKSGWLTFGKKTEEFEKKFAEYIGAPYCVMLDNCTAALNLACECVLQKVPRESRKRIVVGVPSFTCAATALAPIHAGANIVFIDVNASDDFTIEREHQTYADYYIPVHFAGKRCEITDYPEKVLVEDSAHRIVRGGFHGPRQAYSFYVTKCMTTGEGGMIACESKEEADWYRKARLYGNGNAIFEREKMYETGKDYWWFESEFQGWKANPTDVAATIGLVQLEKIDAMNADRARIAKRYNDAFKLTTDRSPWHLYPILVQDRDKFMYYMKDNGVKCSVHFPPLHMMKAFKSIDGFCSNTEEVYKHIVSIPLYPYMPDEEVDYVIDLVLKWMNQQK